MPELPDLQVFSINLNKKLKGAVLKKIFAGPNSSSKVSQDLGALEGKQLIEVYRDGKELRFKFEENLILGIHLMLNGKLHFFKDKHTYKDVVAEFCFDGDNDLVLTDFQNFASVTLNPKDRPAPDALDLTADYLSEKLKSKRTAVKNALIDQDVVKGIGNAYADEILWDAKISPLSISKNIPAEKIKVLVSSVKSVLKKAEEQILKNHPDRINGEDREFLPIHNHRNKKSPTGADIKTTELNKKITYYTDEQEEF